jgi:Fur family ferric uptake transcriptional regulator
MKETQIETILKNHQLRLTTPRKEVLLCFLEKNTVLSHSDVEKALQNRNIDRVTIYRTLKTFVEQHILHAIPDTSGVAHYALHEHENCSQQHNHHNRHHVHFKCENCKNITCLEEINIPPIKLPKGYTQKEMSLIVKGICATCAK